MSFIKGAIKRKTAFLFSLFMLVIFGAMTYVAMPKEAMPEINIPRVIVQVMDIGISPDDGERLIAKPLEKEFKSLSALEQMTTKCYENFCYTLLEFDAGYNAEKGLREVKDAVDKAKATMPNSIEEPTVDEINTSEFPIAIMNIYGNAPEKALNRIAEQLQDIVETIPGVLEADIGGLRTEQVEIIVSPAKLNSYKISISSITSFLGSSNILIPAGNIETAHGSFPLKVPGLILDVSDIINLPIKANGDAVVKLYDIAEVRRNYENPKEYVKMNGSKAMSLEIKKRSGANTINTVNYVKEVMERAKKIIPESVYLSITNDQSVKIKDSLADLQNNVIASVILVMICVILMLGVRAGFLVGISIPISFILGILLLSFIGVGINMMVLFGLILSVALLVDGAIVVTEYADQRLSEGASREEAYADASGRMAIVVISSTITTLMAFVPLLFWPGVMGQFMKFMPLTVSCVLLASMFVALIVVPVLGAMFGPKKPETEKSLAQIQAINRGNFHNLTGYLKVYEKVLDWALRRPWKMFAGIIISFFVVFKLYGIFGVGVEFFPNQEPDFVNINVHARGNLSIDEKSKFVDNVADKIHDMPYFKNVYSRVGAKSWSASEDTIGYIQLELNDWQTRPKAELIMNEIRSSLTDVSGVLIEVVKQRNGPVQGKPFEVEISAAQDNQDKINAGYAAVRAAMQSVGGLINVEDTLPLPGIQWELDINKAQAAKFGISVGAIGSVVQMLTRGAKVSSYMPADLDDEIDILVRFPEKYRSLDMIGNLYVIGSTGASVPLSSFVKIVPKPKVSIIQRIDGRRIIRVAADVEQGSFASAKIAAIKSILEKQHLDSDITVKFRGEAEDSAKSMGFVVKAFLGAIFMMMLTMLIQFNSFYATFMIMFSVILSIMGVLIGLIITREPFSIVMSGIAVVSLAGIVINNNIVLIDAYNEIKDKVKDPIDTLKRTGLSRIRPVFLTAGTTLLGILPMALMINIDFLNASITFGAPSQAIWASFSKSLISGLLFATILTLVITPCMILMGVDVNEWRKKRKASK